MLLFKSQVAKKQLLNYYFSNEVFSNYKIKVKLAKTLQIW